MSVVYLLIGGNLGDVKGNMLMTYDLILKKIGQVKLSSSIIETEPWGFKHKNNFLNQVFKVITDLTPIELLLETQKIEKQLGRVISISGYEARTMDIDILFYDDDIINIDNLIVPHPRLHLRRFTLFPLNEIAENYIHPVLNKTIHELLEACVDNTELKIINT